jgi:hypothetical protein
LLTALGEVKLTKWHQCKNVWGDIFPDGEVPIQSIIAQTATLEGIDRVEKVFLFDWRELTAKQQNTILEKISKRSDVSKDNVLKDVLKVGLPLRVNYTEGCGTSEWSSSRRLGFGSIDL